MSSFQNSRSSRALSKFLRHGKPVWPKNGFAKDGYVLVEDLKEIHVLKDITIEDLLQLTKNNDKQRFSMKSVDDKWYIRANQGHTVEGIEADELLVKLSKDDLIGLPCVVHGTASKNLKPILKDGLKRMDRNHIHFAIGLPGADGVISGMRKSSDVHIYLDVVKASDMNIVFYRSENGVILTGGVDELGIVPATCFQKVVSSSGKLLTSESDGKIS